MANKTEITEKFNNGEQRYQDDQNFKEAVDSLAAGVGVYAVLDKTLNQLRVLCGIHAKTIEQNKGLELVIELQASGLSLDGQLAVLANVRERLGL